MTLKGLTFRCWRWGWGGGYDATNVISPEVSVITSVSFDHTQVLGNTLTQIATEKSGIIKPASVVVLSPQANEVIRVIAETCLNQEARLIIVGKDIAWERLNFNSTKQSLEVKGRLGNYTLSIPLVGQHQLENAATAVAALEVLTEKGFNITRDSLISGLAQVSWPGRLQILGQDPLVVVDGAHNPDAARRLKLALTDYFKFWRAILVMGTSTDKDVTGIVSELAPLFSEVIVTQACHPRAMAPAKLAAIFRDHGLKAKMTESVPEALTIAMSLAGSQDLICVTGSLFVVAEALERLSDAFMPT